VLPGLQFLSQGHGCIVFPMMKITAALVNKRERASSVPKVIRLVMWMIDDDEDERDNRRKVMLFNQSKMLVQFCLIKNIKQNKKCHCFQVSQIQR
jgi:hypothetical protein